MARVGVGVVGAGFGARVWVPAVERAGARVVALCASRLERARDAAPPGARATDDWRDVVADDAVDVVVVATPPFLHREICLAAVAAGKRVVCEKPLALSADEAEELAAAASAVPTLVDFELRAVPAFAAAKARLAEGALGEVVHASARWHVATRLASDLTPGWKDDPARGGGALNGLGSHVLDYAEWLLGPVEAVAAAAGEGEHTFAALLRHASGAVTTVSVSTVARAGDGHAIELYGGRGSLRIANPDASDWMREFGLSADGEPVALPRPPAGEDGRLDPVARLFAAFLGGAEVPSFADGARAQRVAAALRTAAATGRWAGMGYKASHA